ncbi:hypothetical protein C8R47DRAFT_1120157 [Mycena vitilis]|nr:hypothetical protein C8R47DRAFT_1120157 [Mycena vitilis]
MEKKGAYRSPSVLVYSASPTSSYVACLGLGRSARRCKERIGRRRMRARTRMSCGCAERSIRPDSRVDALRMWMISSLALPALAECSHCPDAPVFALRVAVDSGTCAQAVVEPNMKVGKVLAYEGERVEERCGGCRSETAQWPCTGGHRTRRTERAQDETTLPLLQTRTAVLVE